MSYVDQLLIKKTIRLVRGADGGHKTDRNGIFSAIFSTFKEGPNLVKDIEVLMPDMCDKHGWLIGFKSDGSISTLENKRININGSIYRLDNAGIPRERGYEETERPQGRPQLQKRMEKFYTNVVFRLTGYSGFPMIQKVKIYP